MYALSLTQPWATLIALGLKEWETRSFVPFFKPIPRDGKLVNIPIAIHASKGFPGSAQRLVTDEEPFCSDLARAGVTVESIKQELVGVVVATAVITAIRYITEATPASLSARELAYGNYSTYPQQRFMWHIEQVKPLLVPKRASGMLGLWHWDPDAPEPPPSAPRAKRLAAAAPLSPKPPSPSLWGDAEAEPS